MALLDGLADEEVRTTATRASDLETPDDSEDLAALLRAALERSRPRLDEVEKAHAEGRLAEFVKDVPSVREQFERVQAERS